MLASVWHLLEGTLEPGHPSGLLGHHGDWYNVSAEMFNMWTGH